MNRIRNGLLGLAFATLALAGPALAADAPSAAYTITPVAGGLDHPWSIAFLPGGDMLVTERPGRLRIIRDGKLLPDPVPGVPDVYVKSQAGLFDVVLHPDFANNQTIYLTYASGTTGANATTVARARLEGDALLDVKVIFKTAPSKDTAVHFGGRMVFLADGTFLLTLGDGFDYREEAQNLMSDLGKIVRLNDDGSIPQDNPFASRTDARPEIWTYGHRNVQAIVRDALTGHIYAHEHGPKGGDELNLIEPGKNYGWPVITYGLDYSGARISPYTEREGMEQPLVYWVPSIAPSGMTLYTGDKFPRWQGDLFVAALAGKQVRRVDLDDGRVAGEETLFAELDARIRDVREGPDGALYLLTESNKVMGYFDGDEPGAVLRVDPMP